MNLSTTADAPLAVIKASSALAAAQSMILLFNAGSKREGAVMETCMVIPISVTSDDDIITMGWRLPLCMVFSAPMKSRQKNMTRIT